MYNTINCFGLLHSQLMIKAKMLEPSPLKKHWRVILKSSAAIIVPSEPIGSDITVHLKEVRT